jgi:hypothetical protein
MANNLHSKKTIVIEPGSSLGKNWKGHYIQPGKRKQICEFGLRDEVGKDAGNKELVGRSYEP